VNFLFPSAFTFIYRVYNTYFKSLFFLYIITAYLRSIVILFSRVHVVLLFSFHFFLLQFCMHFCFFFMHVTYAAYVVPYHIPHFSLLRTYRRKHLSSRPYVIENPSKKWKRNFIFFRRPMVRGVLLFIHYLFNHLPNKYRLEPLRGAFITPGATNETGSFVTN
jgi:hypothetical protein